MKIAILLSYALLSLCSCEENERQPVELEERSIPEGSKKLASEFPLLPVIESSLWKKLLFAEAVASDCKATAEERADALVEVERITNRLQEKHPFRQEGTLTILGGMSYDKDTGQIQIPVVVSYPKEGDERHPGELEVILCSTTGRAHETLFTTDLRPLHLELLMHLAGYKKSRPASTFKVEVLIPDHAPIAIESLIQSAGSDPLPQRLLWEFSGGQFNNPYLPDMTGDFLICWHAHESVLRIRHKKIASGQIKLKPANHPNLKQNQRVHLLLSPEESTIRL